MGISNTSVVATGMGTVKIFIHETSVHLTYLVQCSLHTKNWYMPHLYQLTRQLCLQNKLC